jgi:hypothetical protein
MWQYTGGDYLIVNAHSGKCLTVYWASQSDNAPVVQYDCEYSAPFNERWYVI